MFNRKRILASFLAVTMSLQFTACGSTTNTNESSSVPPPATSSVNESSADDTSAGNPPADNTAYIDIPEEYRSWNASGDINFDHSGTAENGMVAALRYEPAAIGTEIMKKGGTAIDAAVATAFALTVTMPHMCSIGGGGFMTFYSAQEDKVVYLSFREQAPQFQTAGLWVTDASGEVIGEHNMIGGLAVGVPGEVAGLWHILQTYGTMEWADVIQPSIDMARQGFTVTPELREAITQGYAEIQANDEAASIYLTEDGLIPEAGTMIKNEPLARTYEKLRDGGRDVFYSGEIGNAVVKEAQRTGGVMTLDDLAGYDCWEETPAKGTYRDYTIYSSASPSSGGAFIIQTLNILENLPVQEFGTTEYYHQLAEVQKLVWADRGQYMADTRFIDVPLAGITSKDYAEELAKKVDMAKSQDFSYGDPWNYEEESQNTTNFVVMDKTGNMVALTHTINSFWGSHDYVDGYGFYLNNQLGDFVVGDGYANSVEPGKSPLSSMSPTIVFDPEGKPFMTLGAPGGFMIYPCIAQVLSNVIDYGMGVDEALNTGRIATTNEALWYSPEEFTDEQLAALKSLGHENTMTYNAIGFPAAIMQQKDGTLIGSTEAHSSISLYSDGVAIGY